MGPPACGAELILIEGQRAVRGLKKPTALRTVLRLYSQTAPWSFVGAAFDGGVDDGAGGVIVLGAVVVGFYFELLDGVRAGLHDLIGKALIGGAIGVVVYAVEHEIVQFAALAIDVIGGVAAGVAVPFSSGDLATPGTSRVRSA